MRGIEHHSSRRRRRVAQILRSGPPVPSQALFQPLLQHLLLALMLVIPTGAKAQQVWSLPSPTSTPSEPVVVGPVDPKDPTTLPGGVKPLAPLPDSAAPASTSPIPTAASTPPPPPTPTPASTPASTPTVAPTAKAKATQTPTSRTAGRPVPVPTEASVERSQNAPPVPGASPEAAATTPAPSPEPTGEPSASDIPSSAPSPATAPTPARSEEPAWWWSLLAAAAFALVVYFALRRRAERRAHEAHAEPEQSPASPPAPFDTAVADASPPESPRLGPPTSAPEAHGEITFEPRSLRLSLVYATLRFRFALRALTPIGPARLLGDLSFAHAAIDRSEQLEPSLAALPVLCAIPPLDEGGEFTFEGEVQLPLNAIRPVRQGNADFLVPLVRLALVADRSHPDGRAGVPEIGLAVVFTVGQIRPNRAGEDLPGGALGPFRLDTGPRDFVQLDAREIEAGRRKRLLPLDFAGLPV